MKEGLADRLEVEVGLEGVSWFLFLVGWLSGNLRSLWILFGGEGV